MNRRGFLLGALAAPVIVKAASLMPVRRVLLVPPYYRHGVSEFIGYFERQGDFPEWIRKYSERMFHEASLKREGDYVPYSTLEKLP